VARREKSIARMTLQRTMRLLIETTSWNPEPGRFNWNHQFQVSNGIYFDIVVILNLTVVFQVVAKLVLETPTFT
jgi:hypothetical protein